jgi:hypothetical protein
MRKVMRSLEQASLAALPPSSSLLPPEALLSPPPALLSPAWPLPPDAELV